MPIIACPSCRSRFKVPLSTVGKTLPCPRCKEEFQAMALRSAPRKSHGSGPIVYAAIVVGAILVAFLIMAVAGKNSTEPEPAAASSAPERKPPATSEPSTAMDPKEVLEKRARNLLEALRTGNHPLLPDWIEYQRMHELRARDGLEERSWQQLAQDEQYGKREEYLDLLMGDEATRKFTRIATVESLKTLSMGSGKGKVAAVLRNALTDTTQDLTLEFVTSAGSWKLARMVREPIGGEQAPVEAPQVPARERIEKSRRSPEGEVAEVELIPDTPSGTTREIERALASLLDTSTTTAANQARTVLTEIGRPAIPHLLNALAAVDLANESDLLIATRLTSALTDLTGQDFPIVPGGNAGSMVGEGAVENEINRRKWFGWWRDNRRTFVAPEEPDFGPEDDLPVRKKGGRGRSG
ncbi:MAG: hypothetical protein V2A76_06095 [Planctomycetota bacterium]